MNISNETVEEVKSDLLKIEQALSLSNTEDDSGLKYLFEALKMAMIVNSKLMEIMMLVESKSQERDDGENHGN